MFAVFPTLTATRRRALVAVLIALSAALPLATLVPPAPGNELGDRHRRVHREINQAEQELRHSSKALLRATARMNAAERRLGVAERELERRRTQLAAATVLDAQMQSELDAANSRLHRAQVALQSGRRSHEEQQQVLRQIAARTYQAGSPELMGLTVMLNSQDPSSLSTNLNVVKNLVDKETATLRRLEASRLLLELQAERVAVARREVAERRAAAASSLERRQELEARAAAASAQVADRLDERTKARRAALRTRKADQQRLNQLRRERNLVSRLIAQHQAQLRRQRSRAATARAVRYSRSHRFVMGLPVNSYITSPYGMRLHPIYRAWRLHDGTDFGARCGTPIRAAAPGRVVGRYYNVGYGKRVIVSHGYLRGAWVATTYNHLSQYSARLGEEVRQGEIIGFVGSTGFSTGCHLHFMVFRNGRTTDPMNWLR